MAKCLSELGAGWLHGTRPVIASGTCLTAKKRFGAGRLYESNGLHQCHLQEAPLLMTF